MPTAQNIFLSLVLAPRLQTLLNMDVAFMMSPISVEFLFRSLSISHYVGLLVDGVKFIGVTIFGGKEGSFQQMSSSCIHICWLVLSSIYCWRLIVIAGKLTANARITQVSRWVSDFLASSCRYGKNVIVQLVGRNFHVVVLFAITLLSHSFNGSGTNTVCLLSEL